MKPVFIQSWMISGKYLRSANLPLAMSQMAAMKMWFLQKKKKKKTHSTRNNDAFTHCGISLTSPNTLHQKHSGSLKSFRVLVQFLFHRESGSSFQENDRYTEFESLKLESGYDKWWCNMDWCVCDEEWGRVWAVAWNVELCAMRNEVECGLWHGAIRSSGGGVMRDVVSGGM